MIQFLVFLIIIVFVSALILFLVKSNYIKIDSKNQNKPDVLNAQFLIDNDAFVSENYILKIREFEFCREINNNFDCLDPTTGFEPGETAKFRYEVVSNTKDGILSLIKNYQVLSENGKVILDLDPKNNFYVNQKSNKLVETLSFQDEFNINPVLEKGFYEVKLIIQNPMLNTKAEIVKRFKFSESVEEFDEVTLE